MPETLAKIVDARSEITMETCEKREKFMQVLSKRLKKKLRNNAVQKNSPNVLQHQLENIKTRSLRF